MKINGKIVDDVTFNYSTEDGVYEDSFGNVVHRRNGWPDREDGPALVYSNGQKEYIRNGQRHRNPHEGPAVIFPNGKGDYWEHGRRLKDFCQKLLNVRCLNWVYFLFYAKSERRFYVPALPKQSIQE